MSYYGIAAESYYLFVFSREVLVSFLPLIIYTGIFVDKIIALC